MTSFLDETGAVTAIRDMLLKTDTATLAVAFWGSGAIDKLALDKKWKSLRIVCNLDSGACNPDEIERLMKLDNVDVRTDCRLHG
ncbi:phospholipase D family protein [Ochrobactrum sp. EDr1-4]|uniref:phospholipase D family protein n=1 Tax=Ochrobactrum sp. EDr1-4 TaxID=3368622 RepID=UPI003B9DD724